LTAAEKKQSREIRFGKGGADAGTGAATTAEAAELLEAKKQKMKDRAERFGIVTKEMHKEKLAERKERFKDPVKAELEAKKAERRARFATMEESAAAGLSPEEFEAKKKARLERFGAEEVGDAQKAVLNKGGFKKNRRNNKHDHKHENGKGKGGKFNKNRSQSGKKFKRFKGSN